VKNHSDLQYVQFQPSQDLLDVRFQTMSPAERGVYWTIKLYLYANGGKCPLDETMLAKVTGCENFGEIWEKIRPAFVTKDDTIRHKVVTKDLRKARKCLQSRRRAGLIGAQKRWQSHSKAMAKERKVNVKLSKDKSSNTNTSSICSLDSSSTSFLSDELRFYDWSSTKLCPRNRSDRTCIRQVAAWLRYTAGKTGDAGLFQRAGALVDEAAGANKPMAAFMAIVKSELGYRKLPAGLANQSAPATTV
jgi:uncharacterized protein YdaU (DUF1376 family)